MFLALALTCAPGAFAASCVTASLQSYVNLGATGCQDGSVTFSGFQAEAGQSFATLIPFSQITVTPGGTASSPALMFTTNSTAPAGQLLEAFFRYRATAPGLISSTISLVGSATGNGATTATEDVCAGGTFSASSPTGCTKPSGTPVAVITSGFSMLSDSVNFAPASFFDIFVDLTADASIGGTSSLVSATAQVTTSPVPEPASYTLMAAGLSLVAARRYWSRA